MEPPYRPKHRATPDRRSRVSVLVATVCGVLWLCLGASLGAFVLSATSTGSHAETTGAAAARADNRPNILLITTDDQAAGDLRHMPLTRRLLARQGVSFTHALSPHPLCCPARAEMMTGRYAQNSGVRHNTGRFGGFAAYARGGGVEDNVAVWLHDAGYRTAMVGKYLNGYAPARDGRLPGWDHWNPTGRRTYAYYGTRFYDDGAVSSPDSYVVDAVRDYTLGYLQEFAAQDRPWFIWSSHIAPHEAAGPYVRETYGVDGFTWPVPAVRHEDALPDLRFPAADSPAFNEDVRDKPRELRFEPRDRAAMTAAFGRRIRSLLAVDEANAAVVRALARSGQLDSTYVVFASDNGMLLGQHRAYGKNFGYEEDLQVPLLLRGPGVPAGQRRSATVSVVNLAATFLDIAGVGRTTQNGTPVADADVDAGSLLPTARDGGRLADTQLIQAGTAKPRILDDPDSPVPGWWWRGVRTSRYVYSLWWNRDRSLYDLKRDPDQLTNLVRVSGPKAGKLRDPAYARVLDELERRLSALEDCSGVSRCQRTFGRMPRPAR